MIDKQNLSKCPVCGVFVRYDRLNKHIEKHNQRENMVNYRESLIVSCKDSNSNKFIKTKLVKEIDQGKFLALGYGDISTSELHLVVVSSFIETNFTPDSAIGSISNKIGKSYLLKHWHNDIKPGDAVLVDISKQSSFVNFNYLVVLLTGYNEPRLPTNLRTDNEIWLQIGLTNINSVIKDLKSVNSIDLTALGTQYGGIERKKSFEIIVQWAYRLFKLIPNVNLIRMTSNDIDTFIDFFEALYKLPDWQSFNSLGEDLSQLLSFNLGKFTKDIRTVIQSLDSNPAAAISWCRTIIERVVKEIYSHNSKKYPENLSIAIDALENIATFPPQFCAYLDLVRRLGNFAIHGNPSFFPTRRDAEIILSLVLRIIDYWEEHKRSSISEVV